MPESYSEELSQFNDVVVAVAMIRALTPLQFEVMLLFMNGMCKKDISIKLSKYPNSISYAIKGSLPKMEREVTHLLKIVGYSPEDIKQSPLDC